MPFRQKSPLPPSDTAQGVARRLFSHFAGGESSDVALGLAAEALTTRVAGGLSRWFGPYGSLALVSRALVRVQPDHPSLAGLEVRSSPVPAINGWSESVAAHGGKAASEGAVAFMAALIEVIGRLIGDDLAVTVLEKSTVEPVAGDAGSHPDPGDASAVRQSPAETTKAAATKKGAVHQTGKKK